MKKIYQILILLNSLFIPSILKGQVIAYEGFDYFNNSTTVLHNINTNNASTNLATSLGWASDWSVSGTSSTFVPGYNVSSNSSLGYSVSGLNLVDAGHYLVGGVSSATAGRKLQTSTAGPFATNGTNYITNNHPSTSGKIGRNSTTLWMSFLVRKDVTNDEPVFVSLHSNSTVTDANTGNHIAVGYFGTSSNTLGTRYWSIRINNIVTKSAIVISPNQVTLLVVSINFNSGGASANTVNLYVNPTTIGGSAPALASLTALSGLAKDNSFTSLAYYAGNNTAQSALDEIRFANSYAGATLTSDKIDISGGLCSGAYGSNIFSNGEFGSKAGTNESVATSTNWKTPSAVTFKNNTTPWNGLAPGYGYVLDQDSGPGDGNYTIATGSRNPYGNTATNGSVPFWITSNDRSGTSNGFMMVVNASYTPGIFYQETITGLCENTKYEFSTEVVNLYSAGIASIYTPNGATSSYFPQCDPSIEPGCQQLYSPTGVTTATGNCTVGGNCKEYSILPDIEFLINDIVVYSPPRPVNNDGQWKKLGFTFTTKSGVTQLKLSVRNKAPGGVGNDIGLDNISFRPCGPAVSLEDNSNNCANPYLKLNVGAEFTTPQYLWQKSVNGGITWIDLSNSNSNTYQLKQPAVQPGNKVRVLVANSTGNLQSGKCYVINDATTIGCALPVQINSFRAYLNQTKVELSWETNISSLNQQFILERSSDGINFEKLVTLDGTENKKFYFTDYQPKTGQNYYRLQQINEKSQSIYTEIIAVRLDNPEYISVKFSPNPIKVGQTLKFDLEMMNQKNLYLQIYDSFGKVYGAQNLENGTNEVIVNNLSVGIYYLHFVSTSGFKKVERLVVL